MTHLASRRRFLGAAGGSALTLAALSAGRPAWAQAPTPTPTPTPDVQAALDRAYAKAQSIHGGQNADYIPELAKAPTGLLAAAIMTADGRLHAKGDAEVAFPIESISKVFTAALVMRQIGPQAFESKIGADPTGLPFNSVEALELHGGRPLNPFVNAGAIATTSLVQAPDAAARWAAILGNMSAFAGRPLSVNQPVYASEGATNQHNRGIAWLLQSYGRLYGPPDETLDLYTRQCSVNITTRDLAAMGSVLAAGGLHPVTHQRLLPEACVPPLLAEMALNGLYDASGAWLFQVGLPAKSGVAGGLLAIAPGRYALAAYSPPLDSHGNSLRAQALIAALAAELQLDIFRG